jgi:hypothetical protein
MPVQDPPTARRARMSRAALRRPTAAATPVTAPRPAREQRDDLQCGDDEKCGQAALSSGRCRAPRCHSSNFPLTMPRAPDASGRSSSDRARGSPRWRGRGLANACGTPRGRRSCPRARPRRFLLPALLCGERCRQRPGASRGARWERGPPRRGMGNLQGHRGKPLRTGAGAFRSVARSRVAHARPLLARMQDGRGRRWHAGRPPVVGRSGHLRHPSVVARLRARRTDPRARRSARWGLFGARCRALAGGDRVRYPGRK